MFQGHLQVLFYARPPNSQLLFWKPGNRPFLRILTVVPWGCIKKKSYQPLILQGVPFRKNFEIPKFGLPLDQPCLFSGSEPKSKSCSLYGFALASCFRKLWHNPPAPKPRKEIDLAENPLYEVLAWPRGPWGPNQNYLRGVLWTLIFCADLSNESKESKVTFFFLLWHTDGHPSGHMDHERPTREFFFAFVRGKHGNYEPHKIFTFSLCEGQLTFYF